MINTRRYKYSSLLLLILNYLNIDIPSDSEPFLTLCFGVLTLSLVCLLSLINLIFYLMSIILIKSYDIKIKFKNYPFLIKMIKYYINSTIILVFIEGIICIICLLIIIITCLSFLGIIFKYK